MILDGPVAICRLIELDGDRRVDWEIWDYNEPGVDRLLLCGIPWQALDGRRFPSRTTLFASIGAAARRAWAGYSAHG
ncbi:MAG: hypothetical protein ABW167_07875 [Baekduia sp.]